MGRGGEGDGGGEGSDFERFGVPGVGLELTTGASSSLPASRKLTIYMLLESVKPIFDEHLASLLDSDSLDRNELRTSSDVAIGEIAESYRLRKTIQV
jgi:hypothetical protein